MPLELMNCKHSTFTSEESVASDTSLMISIEPFHIVIMCVCVCVCVCVCACKKPIVRNIEECCVTIHA